MPWPCNDTKYIAHFPEERTIWSYGSGYGGNALLGKKCYALRIASVMARDEGWLAEHMLILKLTAPRARCTTSPPPFPPRAARPTWPCCTPPFRRLDGRDARRRHRLDAIRRRRPAVRHQPRGRLLRRRTRHRLETNPNAMRTIERGNSIFTNVALTDDGDVWWEGMTDGPPLISPTGRASDWTPDSDEPAAHPNTRFCTPIRNARPWPR